MLDRAREYAKRGQTVPAIAMLNRIIAVYKGTAAAAAAQAALDRPRRNLPLFPEGPFVLALKSRRGENSLHPARRSAIDGPVRIDCSRIDCRRIGPEHRCPPRCRRRRSPGPGRTTGSPPRTDGAMPPVRARILGTVAATPPPGSALQSSPGRARTGRAAAGPPTNPGQVGVVPPPGSEHESGDRGRHSAARSECQSRHGPVRPLCRRPGQANGSEYREQWRASPVHTGRRRRGRIRRSPPVRGRPQARAYPASRCRAHLRPQARRRRGDPDPRRTAAGIPPRCLRPARTRPGPPRPTVV